MILIMGESESRASVNTIGFEFTDIDFNLNLFGPLYLCYYILQRVPLSRIVPTWKYRQKNEFIIVIILTALSKTP